MILIDANTIPWEEHYVPDPDSDKQWDYKKELCVLKPVIDKLPTVDAVEVVRIEKVKQEIKQQMDMFIAEYDRIGFYEKSDAMAIARRLVNAALTDLCSTGGAKMDKE